MRALALARECLCALAPDEIAYTAGVPYRPQNEARGVFDLVLLGRVLQVTYPEGSVTSAESGAPLKHSLCLLALHYLVHADGHPLADKWVAFRELPDGWIYDQAFRGRAVPPLIAAYGPSLERFRSAARAVGGRCIDFGDAAFEFRVLPRVSMAVILHLGDEELPPAASVLFDGAAGHYLPTEDLAVLGGMLVGALLQATV